MLVCFVFDVEEKVAEHFQKVRFRLFSFALFCVRFSVVDISKVLIHWRRTEIESVLQFVLFIWYLGYAKCWPFQLLVSVAFQCGNRRLVLAVIHRELTMKSLLDVAYIVHSSASTHSYNNYSSIIFISRDSLEGLSGNENEQNGFTIIRSHLLISNDFPSLVLN